MSNEQKITAKSDGVIPSMLEGTKPYIGCAASVLRITVNMLATPVLWHTRNSAIEHLKRSNPNTYSNNTEVHKGIASMVIAGWGRVIVAGMGALITKEPIAFMATAYYATDTIATSLRRIGWGRVHGVYPRKDSSN